MNDFTSLVSELEAFAKAGVPGDEAGDDKDDDKRIADAALQGEAEGEKRVTGKGKPEDEEDDKPMTKSFSVTLADGTVAEAFDGTEALQAVQTDTVALKSQMEDMQKAFEVMAGCVKNLIAGHDKTFTMVKALNGKVATTNAQGTGRRTMVSIAEKLSVGGAAGGKTEPSANQVMLKARTMCDEGKLGWEALPRIEAFQGRGMIAPPDLLARYPQLLTP